MPLRAARARGGSAARTSVLVAHLECGADLAGTIRESHALRSFGADVSILDTGDAARAELWARLAGDTKIVDGGETLGARVTASTR
jgi:hypothetical protein